MYRCSQCDSCYKTKSALYIHTTRMHEKAFHCDKCPKRYGNQRELDVHLKNFHLGLKPYKCEKCNDYFSSTKFVKSMVDD